MRIPAIRAWQASPDPKISISYGACGNSGGIFHDLYCVWGGTDRIVPVDVYIPGCPPTPAATIYGFAMALGLLDQKIKGHQHDETDGEATRLLHPQLPQPLRVLLDREARRMAGYRYGRQIADQFMQLLAAETPEPVEQRIAAYLHQQDDLRLNEIVGNLQGIYQRVLRGELRL